MTITAALDALFDEWRRLSPADEASLFSEDGVVSESAYAAEPKRLAFVLAEANGREGAYRGKYGSDLRSLFRHEPSSKTFNRNIARWTRLILDNETSAFDCSPEEARQQLHRVAILNLKKTSGLGTADYDAVSSYAQRYHSFLLRQFSIIAPDVIVAGGARVARIIVRKIIGERNLQVLGAGVWRGEQFTKNRSYHILQSMHPSYWGYEKSLRCLIDCLRCVDKAGQ